MSIKNKSLSFIKSKPVTKAEFVETFVLKKSASIGKSHNILQSDMLKDIKNKFYEILKNKYFSKHLNKESGIVDEEEVIDNILKKSEIPRKEKILRNFLTFFDFLIENFEFNFKLSENHLLHQIYFRKLILGAAKGINKNKEIHFICIIHDTKVKELSELKSKKKTVSDFSDYNEYLLLANQKIFLNIKLEYGLFPKSFYSLVNTLNVKADINKTKIEISTRSIKGIFKIVYQLIKLGKLKEKQYQNQDNKRNEEFYFKNKSDVGNETSKLISRISENENLEKLIKNIQVECIEEAIFKKMTSQLKNLKIKLNDMEIRVVSDNHQYIYTYFNFSNFSFLAKNTFNYYYDSNKVKLLKSWAEVKIQDLQLSSYKKDKLILDLQTFTVNLTEDIIYFHQTKEASIRSTVNSDLPNADAVMSTRELDKIIELIICFVVGMEKLEAHSERNVHVEKYFEKYMQSSYLNLNFEKVSVTVHDDKIQSELGNISLNVRVEEDKFVGSKVDIIFSPFSLCVFSKLSTKYSSNILVKGFKLNIIDDLKSSRIDIIFDETQVLVYDNHLIDSLKFIADFLTYCLKGGVKNVYKKKTKVKSGYKDKYTNIIPNDSPTKKKELCTILFKKVIVYYYVDFDDIMTIKLKDFNFYIDDWMLMPLVKIYHQSTTKQFLKKKTKFINLERFYIKFKPDINEVIIDFGNTKLNIYCFELISPITKIFLYHSFLPLWIVYHMAFKHSLDDDYKKIYISDFAKKDKNFIKFGTITVKINQHIIGACAILLTNPLTMKEDLEKIVEKQNINSLNSDANEIVYLRKLKCDQLTIKVTNFVLNTWGFKEKESANENVLLREDLNDDFSDSKNISHYKKIIKKGEISINFQEIEIFHENSKLIQLNDFRINVQDELIYDNFEIDKLNSIACSYKMHNIFYKELNSKKTKHSMVEIFIENLKVNLEDIKIIDKMSLLIMNGIKTVLAFPFNEYALTEIMDQQKSENYQCMNVYLKNFETVVNSIDPISNLIYNRLYLKIDLLSLSTQENPKVKKMELSVFYLTFGFEFSQNYDYPLIILPVCELNIDNINNIIRINVPNKTIKKISSENKIKSRNCIPDNPLLLEDNIYVSELDKFIMQTKSFTIFMNFNYLNTFYKIFENFLKRSDFVKKYFLNKKPEDEKIDGDIMTNIDKLYPKKESFLSRENKIINNRNSFSNSTYINYGNHEDLFEKKEYYTSDSLNESISEDKKDFKLFLNLFDFKIIYLLQYKNEYNTVFKFHTEVKDKGYFGYILRFYSISLKYLNTKYNKRDELKLNTNLFTVSFLNDENFDDDKFFTYDKEIKFSRFYNLKTLKNFNEFMEMPKDNKYKLINTNFFKFFYVQEDRVYNMINNEIKGNLNANTKTSTLNMAKQQIMTRKRSMLNSNYNNIIQEDDEYVDLIFDNKHTLMKIFELSFKRDTMSLKKIEEIYIVVNDIKITWNKFNMDVVNILLFNDILLIVDKIILKIDGSQKNQTTKNNKEEEFPIVSILDFGKFDFVFELNEPQICVQNEIKDSKVLLTTKSKCSVKLSKICVNENSKDFKFEIQVKALALYISPNYMDSNHIFWIGESDENIYYLEENLFNRMLETPNIYFLIFETIKNNPITGKADPHTNMTISVDKIAGDFGNTYFNHFMNIIEVFLFDRGYSYAEQKNNIDSRAKDLEIFRLEEIKNRIKMNTASFISHKKTKQKEINFALKDVVLTLMKENKEIIKLMMKNFEGGHIIYTDKASETSINVKNLKILDLFKNKNETLLTPNFEVQNTGEFEDKIDLVTFRRKDSYVSIGTESKWYVLDYFELNILPLLINTSKYQCDFIIEFFFNNSELKEKSEEEYRNLLVPGDKKVKKSIVEEILEIKTPPKVVEKKNDNEVDYPVYFKHVRINETQLAVSFFLAENSPFNMRNAKLKFSAFEKKDKFYTFGVFLNRFIGHLKFISFTNASNILASLFNWGENNSKNKKKKKDDEMVHRKMLLGNQFNK